MADDPQPEALGPSGTAEAFERAGHTNGEKSWFARDFMLILGYDSFPAFEKAINKAIKTCATLGIPMGECATPLDREIDGRWQRDYKLTRFGCYLTAMSGDGAKPRVAEAQVYFANLAEAFQQYAGHADGVERVVIRGDISDRERSLSGVANRAGIEVYAFFQNAGYRGMYNMDLSRLREIKRVPSNRSPLDFMGKQELAANLFRVTETEAKIKNENLRGQQRLERAAEDVGRAVRKTMVATSGTRPEMLPPAEDIKVVHKGLKQARRKLKRIDKATAKKSLPPARP